jgi:dihydroorotase
MTTLYQLFCQPQHREFGSYDILVDQGQVVEITPSSKTRNQTSNSIDMANLALLPRGVDVQAHLRVPGQPEKETAATGLQAAFYGGYAALLTMPNTRPVIDSVAVLEQAQAAVRESATQNDVAVCFSAAITVGQKGERLAPIAELAKAGVIAFTDDGRGVMSDDLMAQAFRECAAHGVPLLQHAEMEGHGGVLAPGPVQEALGVPAYPATAETDMVERDIQVLAGVPTARYHVLHISSAKTVARIARARAQGFKVTGEVSPHHLFFNCADIQASNSSFKMNPPLRSSSDQAELLRALQNGDLDFVATDHAPHEGPLKTNDFRKAANGTLGLETTLPVLVHYYQNKSLSLGRLVEVWSTAPATFLGLPIVDPLAVGHPLRGVLTDLNAPAVAWTEADFHSLSKNSCFIGAHLPKPIVGIINEHGLQSMQPESRVLRTLQECL